ncbi:hypothetical protein PPO43_00575 [Saprospira sp. CCB-QB6]|uniref:hypothetical protein n=1 Tax=Saprospira sp. CCB-QB6 TaxID=3023936 RepID=UPI00234BEAB4|nr:hypothetical protein [Saprospira sp. CCB-QB6]WCL81589.1 hypothetical protein PPO43_00575 [Saprospira sp. CCB-QB6]
MMSLQQKFQNYKLSKKMLKDFYGISYPTLRKRLRDVGLDEFIGRRKFLFGEFLLIFRALGQPEQIFTELQELAQIYEQLLSLGLLQGQSQKDLPQKGQKKEGLLSSSPKLWLLQAPLTLLNHFIALYYQVLLKGLDLLYGPIEKYAAKQAA